MKNVMLCLILFGMFTLSVFGELTQADLNKISLIVNESEERVKKDIIAEIDSTKKDIKESGLPPVFNSTYFVYFL